MLAETVTQGFIQKGGPGISPPEILKLSIVIIVLSQVLNNNLVPDCIRSNLRGSLFKIFLDPPSRHANLCVREHSFASCYHPATLLVCWYVCAKIYREGLQITLGNIP